MTIDEMIKDNIGTIVDVRTPREFEGGSVEGAVNVPLNEIPERLEELMGMTIPLILCCASGSRSGLAQEYLRGQGVDCLNGGFWLEVNFLTAEGK